MTRKAPSIEGAFLKSRSAESTNPMHPAHEYFKDATSESEKLSAKPLPIWIVEAG